MSLQKSMPVRESIVDLVTPGCTKDFSSTSDAGHKTWNEPQKLARPGVANSTVPCSLWIKMTREYVSSKSVSLVYRSITVSKLSFRRREAKLALKAGDALLRPAACSSRVRPSSVPLLDLRGIVRPPNPDPTAELEMPPVPFWRSVPDTRDAEPIVDRLSVRRSELSPGSGARGSARRESERC